MIYIRDIMAIDRKSLEIEFKCKLTEEKYNDLISIFHCSKPIVQVNHYFDTKNFDLRNQKIVLRIRQKGDQFKLTSKIKNDVGNDESHVFLTKAQGLEMIENGFDANIINLNYFVKKITDLTTYRVSFPYKNGKLFLDKSLYKDTTDYEVEYEASSYEDGEKEFNQFLEEYNIPYVEMKSKIERAFSKLK